MDIELGIQNVARTVTFSTEQSADEVNNVIAEAVENGKTINLTDDKGRRAGRFSRLCHHRLRNQARRRLRQSLIATCKRVGHVPNEKDVGPYQVRRLFHIRFMYPVHAWKFHIRISCGM
jgi:hypothetical protein